MKRFADDEFRISLIMRFIHLHIAFSLSKLCAFDEILFRSRKSIRDDRGGVSRLRLYAIFIQP